MNETRKMNIKRDMRKAIEQCDGDWSAVTYMLQKRYSPNEINAVREEFFEK